MSSCSQVSLDGSNCQGVPTELCMIFAPELNLAAYAPPVVTASTDFNGKVIENEKNAIDSTLIDVIHSLKLVNMVLLEKK